jgi:thymidylate kinase
MPGQPRRFPPIVAIEGPSGSGKSTVSTAVARLLGFRRIPEAFERIRPEPSLRFSSPESLRRIEHRLVEDETQRFTLARGIRSSGSPVVLDTGFVGPLTYVWGLRSLSGYPDVVASVRLELEAAARDGRWGLPDVSVFLDVPLAERRRRIARARSTHPADLEERHRAVGAVERTLWTHRFPRLLPGRVLRIDGRPPVNEVVHRIDRELRRLPARTPPGPEDARRVLRSFRAAPRRRPRRRSGNP